LNFIDLSQAQWSEHPNKQESQQVTSVCTNICVLAGNRPAGSHKSDYVWKPSGQWQRTFGKSKNEKWTIYPCLPILKYRLIHCH